MSKKFGCMKWPAGEMPTDAFILCYGCETKLENIQSNMGMVLDCPTCHGDGTLLAEFKSRVKAYEKQNLHPAHAANKVRKEIRENE